MLNTKLGVKKKDDPATVARQGIDAVLAGKGHVFAGSLLNRVVATAAKILPDRLTALIQRSETEPGSAKGEPVSEGTRRESKGEAA